MIPRPCTKCGVVKGADGFNASRGYADGHQRQCKVCVRAARDVWRKRGGTAKENATPAAQSRKARWRKSDTGRAHAAMPENRAKAVARAQNWTAKQHGAPGRITAVDVQDVLSAHAGLCTYCNGAADTIDHVEPLSGGGRNDRSNLAPACGWCNRSKRDKPLIVWLAMKLSQNEGITCS